MITGKTENFDSVEIYKLIRQLIGGVNPQGETYYDNEAFENLKVLCQVTENLITDIDDLAYKNKDRQEFIMKRAGEFASKWCNEHMSE